MSNTKTMHEFNVIDLFKSFRHETLTLITDYITLTEATLKGGKGLLSQYGGKIYKRSILNGLNDRDYSKAIDNLMIKLNLNGEFETDQHLYADRYIADNGKKSVLSYHRADIDKPELERRNYLNVIPTYCRSVEYFDANMNLINTELLRPYFIDNTSKKQLEVGIPKEKQIVFRNFKLDSFEQITYRNNVYKIIH